MPLNFRVIKFSSMLWLDVTKWNWGSFLIFQHSRFFLWNLRFWRITWVIWFDVPRWFLPCYFCKIFFLGHIVQCKWTLNTKRGSDDIEGYKLLDLWVLPFTNIFLCLHTIVAFIIILIAISSICNIHSFIFDSCIIFDQNNGKLFLQEKAVYA